jgi:hypothetical protein
MENSQFHVICKVLQLFCRIRGYKHVIKYFPHEVWHIELCMSALRAQVGLLSSFSHLSPDLLTG